MWNVKLLCLLYFVIGAVATDCGDGKCAVDKDDSTLLQGAIHKVSDSHQQMLESLLEEYDKKFKSQGAESESELIAKANEAFASGTGYTHEWTQHMRCETKGSMCALANQKQCSDPNSDYKAVWGVAHTEAPKRCKWVDQLGVCMMKPTWCEVANFHKNAADAFRFCTSNAPAMTKTPGDLHSGGVRGTEASKICQWTVGTDTCPYHACLQLCKRAKQKCGPGVCKSQGKCFTMLKEDSGVNWLINRCFQKFEKGCGYKNLQFLQDTVSNATLLLDRQAGGKAERSDSLDESLNDKCIDTSR